MGTYLIRTALVLALASSGGPAVAAEVASVAILTPELGTDYGWNQQGIEAAKIAGKAEGVGVQVADGLGYGDVRAVMRELAEEGTDLIIAHASGYNTAAPEIAQETRVPVAIVDTPGGLVEGLVADYTLSGHEGAYLAGRLAAKMTQSQVIGIVVSGEPPSWNSHSAAFAQGVRAENSSIRLVYTVIGLAAYGDAAGGKRVTESVIAAGADIIFGQGNGASFGMLHAVEAAQPKGGRKVLFIDVIGDKSPIDRGHLLTSVVWNMAPVYRAMIQDLRADRFGTKSYAIRLADDSVRLLKTPQIPDDVWNAVMQVRADIVEGRIVVVPEYDASAVRALVSSVQE